MTFYARLNEALVDDVRLFNLIYYQHDLLQ